MQHTNITKLVMLGALTLVGACDQSDDGTFEDDDHVAASTGAGEEDTEAVADQTAPVRDGASQEITAAPDPSASTACGGAVVHDHGGDLFEATYQVVMGCDCAPGQTRDFFESFNVGNGSCNPIGWESPDPTDCRVRMEIHRSGGFANGHCNLVVEQGPAGDCFAANTTTGCEDPGITACVCASDSFCCNSGWDSLCASEVVSLGCGDPAPCCEVHGGQGCSNTPVAQCVCESDPFCCNNTWDSVCAGEVTSLGCGSCPTTMSGACTSAHTGAGCVDFDVASCVCATDSFCCTSRWDSLCVSEVTSLGCG